MESARDYRICDLEHCSLALRDDLTWTPVRSSYESYYVVEDPIRGKFYRIGLPEYTFISLLDGHITIGEALAQTARALPQKALSTDDAAAVCSWLLKTGLARNAQASHERVGQTDPNAATQLAQLSRWNPLIFRVPLLHPDDLFTRFYPWLTWVVSPLAFAFVLVLLLLAGNQVIVQWDQLGACFARVFTATGWFWLPVCWMALRVIHETAHGLVCKKYGGVVREAGLLFVLLFPISYVDVTSSWRFSNKWERIFTAAAGMYIEMAIAAVTVLIWSCTEPGELNSLCFQVIMMAGITTVIFNANFLMKFDGYYVLSDLLEIPNLSQTSQQYLIYVLRRYVLWQRVSAPRMPGARSLRVFVCGYGAAALVWRIMVCAGLVVAACTLLRGAGIVLAVVGAGLWLAVPTARFMQRHVSTDDQRRGLPWRGTYVAFAVATSAVAAVFMTVPWPFGPDAPAVVDYKPLTIVRAASAGFVRDLPIENGQWVETGQVLAVLENEDLQWELADFELAARQSEIKSRVFEHQGKMATCQAEMEYRVSIDKKLKEKQEQVDQLTIRASTSGRALLRELDALRQAYLETGTEILVIGNERNKELRLSIPQEEINAFRDAVGQPVEIRLTGREPIACRLSRIEPRASLECTHPCLYAVNGGPLPVKPKSLFDSYSTTGEAEYELLTPHFMGFIDLSSEQSLQLNAGQVAAVVVTGHREAIGKHLYHVVRRWVTRKLRAQKNPPS